MAETTTTNVAPATFIEGESKLYLDQLKNAIGQSLELNYLILISITLSFIFSYFTVKFFLDYINKFSLNIFVIYRIIISIVLFIIIYN